MFFVDRWSELLIYHSLFILPETISFIVFLAFLSKYCGVIYQNICAALIFSLASVSTIGVGHDNNDTKDHSLTNR